MSRHLAGGYYDGWFQRYGFMQHLIAIICSKLHKATGWPREIMKITLPLRLSCGGPANFGVS